MTDTNASALVGQTLLGKLRVIRLLGEGGMGAVYEVEHLITKHRRALKVLHAALASSADALQRFLREAGVAGTLRSEYVVETYDAGQLENGAPYVVMELLQGMPLSDVLKRGSQVPPKQVARLLLDVCDGLSAAHAAGIIHRDLKPDNLYLVRDPSGRERVKILDFGISKFTDERARIGQHTTEGLAMGTPAYMPPEQLQGLPDIDARADIYALGVILYESVSGKRPFEAGNYVALALRVYQGDYTRLTDLVPGLDPEFSRLVDTALATDREKRFPNVRALRDALARVAGQTETSFLASSLAETMSASAVVQSGRTLPQGSNPPRASKAETFNARAAVAERPTEPEPEAAPRESASETSPEIVRPTPTPRTGFLVGVVVAMILLTGAAVGIVLKASSDRAERQPISNPLDAPLPHREVPSSPRLAPAPTSPPSELSAAHVGVQPAAVDAGPVAPVAPVAPVERTHRPTEADRAGLHTHNPY